MTYPTTTRVASSPSQGQFSRREFRIQRLSTDSASPSLPRSPLSSTKEECCVPSPLPMMKSHRPGLYEWRRATGEMVDRPRMTRIGLYSEDRSLHPLLSSALGKDFEVLLQSDGEGTDALASTAGCDVMILDLYSSQETLQARLEFTRRLIASNVPAILMADDSLRSTAFELVRIRRLWLLPPPALDSRSQDHAQPGL